jgi:cystathionine beta-lyase/cystathionine gamma-synthase
VVAPVQLYLGTDLSFEGQARRQKGAAGAHLVVGIEHVDNLVADIQQGLRLTCG